ncbi:tripartite tricarboxylate transporter substrate binding protein [Pseudoroseomonas globiformis]|uniref:Tripartite tricarboxylate transporter substrate binding protein n=1 Tax=Teichococcus globiformis TaxID=2307229 RepID=A0ABV7G500_9PROT
MQRITARSEALFLPRRRLLQGGAAMVAGLGALAARAPAIAQGQPRNDGFPLRPITLTVPFPPGGGVDTIARAVSERMGRILGTTIIVDNKPGGSTSLAAAQVSRAAPDGYSLFIATPASSINPVFQPDLPPGDTRKAFTPIGAVARLPYVLVTGPGLPAEDVAGLIAWSKANPGALNLGNSGAATAPRFAAELLAFQAGLKLVTVPYKGGAAEMLDITSGRLHGAFAQMIEVLPMLENGARALAVSSPQRSPRLPDVPALAETLPGFDVTSWNGLFAPPGTPAPVVARLNAALNEAVADPDLRRRFAEEGVEFVGGRPEDLAQRLDSEIAKWTRLRESANLRLD